MQFCEDHWAALKEALDERGLTHLIRESGEGETEIKYIEDIVNVDLNPSIKNFDPLKFTFWCITANVLHYVGLQLFDDNEDGTEKCPICFIAEDHAEKCTDSECTVTTYEHWIDAAADDALLSWEELKARERGDAGAIQ